MKKFTPFIGIALYGIMLFTFTFSSCGEMTPEEREAQMKETYYVKEKFVIINSSAAINVTQVPTNEKNWLVKRIVQEYKDTLEFAELHNAPQIGTFAISNELWYSKKIGDTLYFDYILKSRFFKIPEKSSIFKTAPPMTQPNPYAGVGETVNTPINKMEAELEILRLERELGRLKDELTKLQ
jgi:hypothetical protein